MIHECDVWARKSNARVADGDGGAVRWCCRLRAGGVSEKRTKLDLAEGGGYVREVSDAEHDGVQVDGVVLDGRDARGRTVWWFWVLCNR